MPLRQKRKRRQKRPRLRLSPYAWAKLRYLRDAGPTEIGGFGLSSEDDPLLIEDIRLVQQSCDWASVSFDDESVADLLRGDYKQSEYGKVIFHILATEDRVHVQQNHEWHMQSLATVCQQDPQVLLATPYHVIDVTDPEQVKRAIRWWTELTEAGGEGMVVKPLDFIARGKRGLLQPAVKCRGREYLRIIYSPNYTSEANLSRLRSRGLGTKRSLALREFALGVEALERFVRREPLRRVHECVFGVLALESEPVDPRL